MQSATKPTVDIYVRLGDSGNPRDRGDEASRDISFRIPEGIDPFELLDHGFAIDGNQALATVAVDDTFGGHNYHGPFDCEGPSLSTALRDSQRDLIAYLRERGFEPRFA